MHPNVYLPGKKDTEKNREICEMCPTVDWLQCLRSEKSIQKHETIILIPFYKQMNAIHLIDTILSCSRSDYISSEKSENKTSLQSGAPISATTNMKWERKRESRASVRLTPEMKTKRLKLNLVSRNL